MPFHFQRSLSLLKALLLTATLTLPFQNCGSRFQLDEAVFNGVIDQDIIDDSDNEPKDTSPPSIAILSPIMNSTTNGSLNITGTCEAGLDVLLTVNGSSMQSLSCEMGTFTDTLNLTVVDGQVDLNVSQTDLAGNTGSSQVSILKDSVEPQVQINSPMQNASITSQALSVTGSCESGIPVHLSGTLLSAPAQVNCVNSMFQANVSAISTNGSYTLVAEQTDAADNKGSVSRNISLNIPLDAPVIKITSPAANSATRTGITISGSCTNALPVRISGTGVNQTSQVNCNSGSFQAMITFSAGDGTKNIIVSQTNVQNTTGQDSRSFILDTTPPAIAILAPAAGTMGETSLMVSGSCESGRPVTVSGAGVASTFTTQCSSSMFQVSVPFSNGTGSKLVTVTQTDAVGNTGNNSRSFERIAPVLDGQMLYATHCASCHNPLSNSTKTNRTAGQISTAITSIAQMRDIRLSSAQIAEIAKVLERTVMNPVACNNPDQLLAPQVKRLTGDQFANSMRNAFGNIFQSNQFPNFNDSNPRIGLAADPGHLKIDEVNINGLWDSVNLMVPVILASNSTVSTCVSGTSNSCFDNIITSMGLKLWRRPLTSSEVSNIQTGLNTVVAAGANRQQRMDYILKTLIMAPEHLFRTEIGASATPATAIFSLTQYEIASLLSFTIWDSPPDDTLLDAARTNSLSTKAQLRAQLDRMIQSPLYTRKMANFTIDVLKLDSVRTVTKDPNFGMTTADRSALLNSARTTLEEIYSNRDVDFMAPFSTQRFHTNNLTARYFGVSTSGLNSNFTPFTANSSQRFGMLSHPAFLTTIAGEVGSGIVRRGVFTIEQLLCQHIGSPPADTSGNPNLPPGWDPNLVTTREELHVAHSSQTSCIGCHQKIDPAGFGFENYNTFGQFRTVEKANIPIDASGYLEGLSPQPIVFTDSVSYLRALESSGTMRQCMQQHFFKYASGQSPESDGGQCEFTNFEYQMSNRGQSIRAIVESFIELDSFTRRNPAGL